MARRSFASLLRLSLVTLIFSPFATSHPAFAVDPQYYNYNTGGTNNGFPFSIPSGKMTQNLFLPGEFSNPSPAPGGQITSVFVRLSEAWTNKPFIDLTVKMGQTTLTDLTMGTFYSGPMTTVYYRSSTTVSAPSGWYEFVLDTPFLYDPTMSIVIEMSQCQSAINTGGGVLYTITSGIKRVWSFGGCPFAPFSNSNAYVVHTGINVESSEGIESTREPQTRFDFRVTGPTPVRTADGLSWSCELPSPGYLVVTLHDATGREVARIDEGLLPAGTRTGALSPQATRTLPSGVYFVRGQAGRFTETDRILLIR